MNKSQVQGAIGGGDRPSGVEIRTVWAKFFATALSVTATSQSIDVKISSDLADKMLGEYLSRFP